MIVKRQRQYALQKMNDWAEARIRDRLDELAPPAVAAQVNEPIKASI